MSTMFSEYESCRWGGNLPSRNPKPAPYTEEDKEPVAMYFAPKAADYVPQRIPRDEPA